MLVQALETLACKKMSASTAQVPRFTTAPVNLILL